MQMDGEGPSIDGGDDGLFLPSTTSAAPNSPAPSVGATATGPTTGGWQGRLGRQAVKSHKGTKTAIGW